MANIKNSNSKLGKQRSVECPTCHAKAGEHCVSVGLKGKVGGKLMTTNCHSQRIIASGQTPPYQKRLSAKAKRPLKPAPAAKFDSTAAGKKAWKTRLARQRAKIDEGFGDAIPAPRLSLHDLISKVLGFLDGSTSVNSISLSVEGVGVVTGHPTGDPKTFQLAITKA